VIDVGKFFYQSAIDVFPAVGLRQIDAVVLTHEHADATNGLDDLRDWTLNIGRRHGDGPLCIPVWGDAATLERVTNAFPYLVEPSRATGSGLVPKLSFHRIEAYEEFCPSHPRPASTGNCLEIGASLYPLESDRLRLLPIPVAHGRDQGCLAFRFGDVVYMSDVSSIPPKAMDAIRGCRVLIVDALHPGAGSHVSHFCEQQALELVLALRPEHTFFTGMTHMWDHDRDNERLAAWAAAESRHAGGRPLHVELAHDGLCVPVNL
jgi:phosphoribosyl 1,2-cyclic phosphodiesterase